METVYNYLYNYFTKHNLLVPNIPTQQVNHSIIIAYVQLLKSGAELPPIQVFTQNNIDFIAGGVHEYLACLKLNLPVKIEKVDNIGLEGGRLPLMFYNEWYRVLTNIKAEHANV